MPDLTALNPSATITVRALAADEPTNWPEALTGPATFTALDSWSKLARTIYKYPSYRFETEAEGRVTGLLALTHVRHPIFGNYLTTAPFGSYGGFAYADEVSRLMLLGEARRLLGEVGAEYVNLRFEAGDQTPPPGWVQHPVYTTYLVDLAPETGPLLQSFSSDHRNHVRKSLKKGFTVKFGHLDLLDDAYETLARSMHELGSPYHAQAYLKLMAESLAEALEFVVVYSPAGKLAGAGVFITHGKTVTNLHANILREFRADYAGEFLYWSVIERYASRGYQVLDLGRSLNGSGNETFKTKWKPSKHPLAYWYALRPGVEMPSLNQKNPKFAAAIWLWKRLPGFIVRPLGPFLIRGLA